MLFVLVNKVLFFFQNKRTNNNAYLNLSIWTNWTIKPTEPSELILWIQLWFSLNIVGLNLAGLNLIDLFKLGWSDGSVLFFMIFLFQILCQKILPNVLKKNYGIFWLTGMSVIIRQLCFVLRYSWNKRKLWTHEADKIEHWRRKKNFCRFLWNEKTRRAWGNCQRKFANKKQQLWVQLLFWRANLYIFKGKKREREHLNPRTKNDKKTLKQNSKFFFW